MQAQAQFQFQQQLRNLVAAQQQQPAAMPQVVAPAQHKLKAALAQEMQKQRQAALERMLLSDDESFLCWREIGKLKDPSQAPASTSRANGISSFLVTSPAEYGSRLATAADVSTAMADPFGNVTFDVVDDPML